MYLFLILKSYRKTKLLPKLILLSKEHKSSTLKRIQIFSKISKSLLKYFSMLSNLLLNLAQSSTVLHCDCSCCFELLLINTYSLDLICSYWRTLVNLGSPTLRITCKTKWRCIWREDIGRKLCIVEKISRRSRKHWVYNLFEVIIQLCKSLLSVCTYSILHDCIVTLIKSMRRLIRSRSG